MKATIYHNPRCSKSRETLALLEQRGADVTVVRYLDTPPSREVLTEMITAAGLTPRDLIRSGEAAYRDLGLSDLSLSDNTLIDAMVRHPSLMNRPLVVTAKGTRLCRPPQAVLEIL